MTDDFAIEPISRPLPIGDYLDAVREFVCQYVSFPSEHEAVAVALWVAHAHLVDRYEVSPILAVTSAEMRSGKTRTLDCLEVLVPNPFRVVMPSEAVVYTVLSQRPRPTLLLDEADAIFGTKTAERYEGLRAILNSGNRTGTPVLRVKLEGRRREVEAFDVFGPKVVAGIGELPATVADRSVPIRMKRRAQGDVVARFRQRQARAEADDIVLDLASVPLVPLVPGPHGGPVDVPEELPDRAADSWEVLLSIADAAGGEWPAEARAAAIALSGEGEVTVSLGIRLLTDIKDVFGDATHLSTHELLAGLHELDDAPWGDWYGSPLTARYLAKLLLPYGLGPIQRRVKGSISRGYFATDFTDAWRRYCPAPGDEPVQPVQPVQVVASTPTLDLEPTPIAVVPLPTSDTTTTVRCADYMAHRSAHRRDGDRFVCDACLAVGAA